MMLMNFYYFTFVLLLNLLVNFGGSESLLPVNSRERATRELHESVPKPRIILLRFSVFEHQRNIFSAFQLANTRVLERQQFDSLKFRIVFGFLTSYLLPISDSLQ